MSEDEKSRQRSQNSLDETEPMFNDRDRGNKHRIVRKKPSMGILSKLPSSAQYVFICLTFLGLTSVIYFVFFTNIHTFK